MRLIEYSTCRRIVLTVVFVSTLCLHHPSRADDNVADDVPISFVCEANTCLECLNLGCGWFPLGGDNGEGECVDSCSVIADAPCYSDEFFASDSPQTICNRVIQDEEDSLLCGNITDCRTCTSTSKGDAISMCVWYDISNTCGHGLCLSFGCGSASCPPEDDPSMDVSSPPSMTPSELNTMTSSPPSDTPTELDDSGTSICERSSVSCQVCLESGCGWTNGGVCWESCSIIADIPCYDNTTFANVTEATEICARAEVEESDASLCQMQTSCSTCTSVPLSIVNRTCIWYEVEDNPSISSCCLACDVPGVPTTTCANDDEIPPAVVCNATSCEACLLSTAANATTCGWSGEACITSCDTVDAATCYSLDSFPKSNATEICAVALDPCRAAQDCQNCTMILQSDNETACVWYAANTTGGLSYCGSKRANGCDGNGICGASECNAAKNNTDSENINVPSASARTKLGGLLSILIFLFCAIDCAF